MGEIDAEFARVRAALDKPTVHLLSRPTAAVVVAVFRVTFSREQQYVPADRLHLQVDEYLAELASLGLAAPATQTGRTLCRQWVHDQWLVRTATEDGEEQYSLTSHALEALSLVEGLSHDRALISESRLAMILDSVRRWASKADPDRDERIRRIDAELAGLTAERERLLSGGAVDPATDDQMRDGYQNLTDLIRQLPSDFKRVEESVAAMHRSIVSDFRSDARPIGEILDEYLRRTDELMTSTAEGRAFEGAFELLRNESLLTDLKNDLGTIVGHSFSGGLSSAERRSFRGTVTIIRQGIEDVLAQRRRLTATLRDQIVSHDVVQDRHLDDVLRAINQELEVWMMTAGPRSTVPLPLVPAGLDIEHLRERFYDPDAETVPPALTDEEDGSDAPVELSDLRKQGGPLLSELRDSLVAALAAAGGRAGADGRPMTAHDVFSALDADHRRPVELFGLVHLVTRLDAFDRDAETVGYETVRPDGSIAVFDLPRFPLEPADADALVPPTDQE